MWKFFLLVSLMSFFYSGAFAQTGKVNVKVDGAPLSQVIQLIENQTKYRFSYRDEILSGQKNITLDLQNATVQEVLDAAFSGRDISYRILSDKSIVLFTEPEEVNNTITLTGTVKDNDGNPLIGVGVILDGKPNVGTVSDENGNWSLTVPKGSTLQFSSIGYKTVTVAVGNRSVINVTMEEDINRLDDVIVIGYGTARKADLTGSTASVQGDKLAAKNTPNLSTQLQGLMPGVQVTRNTSDPAAGATIRVRGITTMSTNDPLVIIDGVPGSLDSVSPEDVKDIQVLKDAASAAIYGSRAAAGVILVTTKRAKNNDFSLSYNFEYGIDKATAIPQQASIVPWMIGLNELAYNDGASSMNSRYPEDLINNYASMRAGDPDLYPDTDWFGLGLKKTTNHHRHGFTLSGGTEKLTTVFSFNYYDADALYDNKNYKRYNARINNDYKINDWIHASVDMGLTHSDAHNPQVMSGSYVYSLMERSPLFNAYWSDGEFADAKDGDNSIAAIHLGGQALNQSYTLNGKVQLDITPFKNFTLTALVAPQFNFYYGKSHVKKFDLRNATGGYIAGTGFGSTSLSESRNNSKAMTSQLYANYKLDLGGHSISAMAGFEGYSYSWENLGASRTNYTLNNFPYLDLGPADYQFNNGTAGHNAYQSFFSRLMYSFRGKYLLQANVRADGSSRFAKEYRWGVFPSVSAGWVISEEPWFNVGPINYLKIRGSVGQLGNERIGSEFPYQAALNFGSGFIPNSSTGETDIVQTAYQADYAFKDITWETTTTYGAGLDLAMFRSRLHATFDAYYKKTEDMLIAVGFPSYFGYNSPQGNNADMFTKGWDLDLSWNDSIGDFRYGISFNISDYRSRMGYMADKQSISNNKLTEEGSFYQEWYGYQSKGIILNEEAMYNSDGTKIAVLTNNDKPGALAYVDQDGDGKITASQDRVKLGNSLPEYLYGGSINAGWKGFDFNLSFQGVGHQLSYWSWGVTPFLYQAYSAPQVLLDSHWSPSASDEQNSKAKYPYLTTNTTNIFAGSDFYLFNGAYMRIKDITLGYTVPSEISRKIRVNRFRIYASINDLPAFSKYPKGYDPEWNKYSDFIMTSFIFGTNITF